MTTPITTLGLISDTHLPDRLRALPPEVFDALDGVDLILHAGDVGTLAVLDQLSTIAPVVAVHGNDDSAEAIRELPAGPSCRRIYHNFRAHAHPVERGR